MAKRRTFFFDGLGVSSGIAIGTAFVLPSSEVQAESYTIWAEEVDAEIRRFEKALRLAKDEVIEMGKQVAEKIDRQQAMIFDAHEAMLDDPHLVETTKKRIRDERRNAEAVFWSVVEAMGAQFKALKDEYFAERNHDLYDIGRRVLKFLRKSNTEEKAPKLDGCIIVASDLGPGEAAQFHKDKVAGFCTDAGGRTSHTAIIAKALSLPAVIGLDYVTHYVHTGDQLILDGLEGRVILNPSAEQLDYYRERGVEYTATRRHLAAIRDLPAVTRDGCRISLQANLDYLEELDAVKECGSEGIGLFRTEFLYLGRKDLPPEQEQFEAYGKVLQQMGNRPVTFRTLDLGGDKIADVCATLPEANPFLGLRAIRLCLRYPELLHNQLRPLLRAAAGRELRLMIPMVSSIEEVRQTKHHLADAIEKLRRDGQAVPRNIVLGVMIEIPSAALIADALAREVDFFSIGTNDLVQYTLAVDRVNKAVAHLYATMHPAVLHLIERVIDAGRRHDKPVCVCGEMAGVPELALLLMGMGIRELSMGPSSIAPVKRVIRKVTLQRAEALAREVHDLVTAEQVAERVTAYTGDIVRDSQN